MSRHVPALLVFVLAFTGPVRADDAKSPPPLESRVGRTITVVEPQRPAEKALITQVWKLSDGSPVMQAQSKVSGLQMTLVENLRAKSAADAIKVYRWTKDGLAPMGCPVPPVVAKVESAPKATPTVKNMSKPVATKSDKVLVSDGGLLPVMPKKDEPKTVMTAGATQPISPTGSVANTTKKTKEDLTLTPPASAPTSKPVAPAKIMEAPTAPMKVTTTVQAAPAKSAPAVIIQTAPVVVAKPEMIGGCEVITVTENGQPRKYKVLGTSRDKDGMMAQRCQALDTGECVTLNCSNCSPPVCNTPCPPACPPVKCEPAKPVCPPVACEVKKPEPVKVPCEPAKVACEPVKKCEPAPCVTKACDPCKDVVCERKVSRHKCDDCCDAGCDKCGHRFGRKIRDCWHDNFCQISVPVPGVRLSTANGMPSGPPPQPMVPAFCTMNSSSVRAYMCSPQCVPLCCLQQPFGHCLNSQIANGIAVANDPVEAEAIQNTLYLVNVLGTSKSWENRQWAAQRLQGATLPKVKPYVEDVLMASAQHDQHPQVRIASIRTLAQLNPARQEMLSLLSKAAPEGEPAAKIQQAGSTK